MEFEFPKGLVDLEVLKYKVYDTDVRILVDEAINCYYNGAYRSAINNIWNAIIYDILKKAEFLYNTFGDSNSKDIIEKIRDINKKIKEFEEIVKEYFYEKIKAIDKSELKTLEYIYLLRNKSSHPSFFKEEGIYIPNAEDVRMAIRTSIEIVLSQKPILGKSALEYIRNDIYSDLVPLNYDDFKTYVLDKGYIENANHFLIRNLLISFFKDYFNENEKKQEKAFLFLRFLIKHKKEIFEKENDKIINIIDSLPSERISLLISLIIKEKEFFNLIMNKESIKIKIREFIKSIKPIEVEKLVFKILYYKELNILENEVRRDFLIFIKTGLVSNEVILQENISEETKKFLLEAIFDEIPNLNTFQSAGEFVYRISPFLKWLKSEDELLNLLDSIKKNGEGKRYNQILDAGQRLENLQFMIANIPIKLLEENKLLIEDFLNYIQENHNFSEEEIKEIYQIIKKREKQWLIKKSNP